MVLNDEAIESLCFKLVSSSLLLMLSALLLGMMIASLPMLMTSDHDENLQSNDRDVSKKKKDPCSILENKLGSISWTL